MNKVSPEQFPGSGEQSPAGRLTGAVDRLSDRGVSIDWMPGLRPTDECTPFIPIFPEITDATTRRIHDIFRGHVYGPNSTTVGYAFRPRVGTANLTERDYGAISDYAAAFVTTHTNGTVTEVLFHHRGERVWTREHLYEAPTPGRFDGLKYLKQDWQDLVRETGSDYRLSISGGKLREDYNRDRDMSTIIGDWGVMLGDDVTGMMTELLDTSLMPDAFA